MRADPEGAINSSKCRVFRFKAHTGFEPVSAETEVPEPLRRKLDELRAQSKKKADERQ
jgi:hypothetical protein